MFFGADLWQTGQIDYFITIPANQGEFKLEGNIKTVTVNINMEDVTRL